MTEQEIKTDVIVPDESDKQADRIKQNHEADKIVTRHTFYAAAAGLIPIPAVDIVAITGIQLKMLASLSKNFDIPFAQNTGKHLIAALTGGAGHRALGGVARSFAKAIPFVGQFIAPVSVSIIAGATTYAIGKVFTQHYASGGTFLNFDPAAVKAYYEEQFEQGKTVAAP